MVSVYPDVTWQASRVDQSPIFDCGVILSTFQTITGTKAYGSSLFLARVTIPAQIAISEIDAMLGLQFNASSDGAGTMSRTMAVYSFGNSTSLASMFSASGSSAWTTGTSTAGASTSITQFQGGWQGTIIAPMTFASTLLSPGEYVIGQIFDFAQLSSTWSLTLFGAVGAVSRGITAFGTPVAVSAFTATGSSSLTAWSAAPTAANALSSGGLVGVSAFTGSGSIAALSNAGTLAINNYELSSNSFAGSAASAIATATAISTKSFSIQARTIFSASPTSAGVFASTALSAGSFVGTSGSVAALSNAGTSAFAGFMGSGGLSAGSFLTASAVGSAMSQQLVSMRFAGTGSTNSVYLGQFICGRSNTGAIPATIDAAAAANQSVSQSYQVPWFALIGA